MATIKSGMLKVKDNNPEATLRATFAGWLKEHKLTGLLVSPDPAAAGNVATPLNTALARRSLPAFMASRADWRACSNRFFWAASSRALIWSANLARVAAYGSPSRGGRAATASSGAQ